MNILYVVMLLSVICHVYASETSSETSGPGRMSSVADSEGAHKFMDAVERRELEVAKETFEKGDEEHKRYYVKYLIGLGKDRLVELIKRGYYLTNGFFLSILMIYAEREFIEEIIKGADLSGSDMSNAAGNTDLACKPNKFIDLLQIITKQEYQCHAIDDVINALFDVNKIECVEPLVDAIQDEPSLSQEVKDYAIQRVFHYASNHPSDETASIVKHYHNHPAITAEAYLNALYRSYKKGGPKKELFYWLLVRADREDLEAVKSNTWGFPGRSKEFQDAVNHVLSTLSPEAETRHQRWFRKEREGIAARIAAAREALEGYVAGDPFSIISGYLSQ